MAADKRDYYEVLGVSKDASEDEIIAAACADEKIQRQMEGKTLVKTIVVKGKIVNLILK